MAAAGEERISVLSAGLVPCFKLYACREWGFEHRAALASGNHHLYAAYADICV